ncbi:hypothetical protein R1flu_020400 [Riccia fluitans]|uniref:Uncharacterized protein n=1 Tax=Riccia fluitans TaxID=41844 RepID=A0ABD1ZLV1_9MARC
MKLTHDDRNCRLGMCVTFEVLISLSRLKLYLWVGPPWGWKLWPNTWHHEYRIFERARGWTSRPSGRGTLASNSLCVDPLSLPLFACGSLLVSRWVRVICFVPWCALDFHLHSSSSQYLHGIRTEKKKGEIFADKEEERAMATMAVTAASSSLRLLPPVDGLRIQQQSAACAKAAPLLKEKSHRRCSIVAEGVDSTTTSTATTSTASSSKSSQVVTIEYQRQRAKELQDYFAAKKYEEETIKGRTFGWTRKNEITNGRWTMFGIAVGLLTEFATGADFVEQLKIIVSNLGIVDLD